MGYHTSARRLADDPVQRPPRRLAAQPGPGARRWATRSAPRGPRTRFAVLRELGGATDDRGSDIYLSDGGHFENLGLYEMVRRRCRYIIVSDAGADPECAFSDLGGAVRKVKIDFDVDIEFKEVKLAPRNATLAGKLAYATAEIKYPPTKSNPKGWIGQLIYLKPSVIENLPMDVNAYAIANLAFPHESTADQWYGQLAD